MSDIKVLISKEKIEKRVEEIAQQVNQIFAGEDELIAICVLKGASVFYIDLIRKIKIPLKCEFVKISSYGSGTTSLNKFSDVSLNTADLNGKNVLLVEDIVDSGRSIEFLNKYFLEKFKMKNYKTVAFLNKPSARKCQGAEADIYGFEIGNEFVVGYGLDVDQKFRNLDFVGLIQ